MPTAGDPASDVRIDSLLLIDDSKVEQMMYRRLIERSGMVNRFSAFVYAQDALEHLTVNRGDWPDMILLDINMPRMDGFEFVAALEAAAGDRPLPPIVMLTTSLDPRDEERAKRSGAIRDLFIKPLTVEDLGKLPAFLLPAAPIPPVHPPRPHASGAGTG